MIYKSYCILHFACTPLRSNTEPRNWVYLFEQNITSIRIQFICMEALLTAKHNFKLMQIWYYYYYYYATTLNMLWYNNGVGDVL